MNVADWRAWNAEVVPRKRARLLDKLVRDNLRLVGKFVDRQLSRTEVYCDVEEAMQAGLIGLLRAIQGFDPDRGFRFSTYAASWIRGEVTRCLTRQTQIYRPANGGMPNAYSRKEQAHEAKTGREAGAEDLGVKKELFEKWKASAFSYFPLDEKAEHFEAGGNMVRIDRFVADESSRPDYMLQEAQSAQKMRRAMLMLTPFEREVFIEGKVPQHWPIEKVDTLRRKIAERLAPLFDE